MPVAAGGARSTLSRMVLVATAIGLAVYLSANEEHEPSGGGEHAALSPV